jgi:hypothetical protein
MRRRAARGRLEQNVVNGAIHRTIEHHAATQPDTVAIVEGTQSITYRELNQRANTLARRLGESGLTRGGVALVRMERGVDLAIVLLAVLKAGAAYAWTEPGSPDDIDLPTSFCIRPRRPGADRPYLAIDIRGALGASATRPSPNLPILTRGSDIACVLQNANGDPEMLVPHSSITTLATSERGGEWSSDPGAFDVWLALMSGATIALSVAADAPGTTTSAAA